MKYSIEKIKTIISGFFINKKIYTVDIQSLIYDSRLFLGEVNSLFFALKSQRNDGHKYIKTLYEKGCRNFVVEDTFDISTYPNANFLQVRNSIEALQTLAKFHRKQFTIPVIGITGSNGKTIVKEWLYQLLSDDYEIVRSPKSYNSQIGVPISVWQMNETHNLAIFEAGVSAKGEMRTIAPIIDCNIGIFTNIGDAHSEGFESIENKIAEKVLLYENTETIIYCKDNVLIDKFLLKLKKKKYFSWSVGKVGSITEVNIQKQENQTEISAIFNNQNINITIPFTDEASIENAIHCWACALYLQPETDFTNRFLPLSGVALRLELKAAVNHCTLINDSYSADLTSLTIAMNFLEQQSTHRKRTLILSDILQSTLSSAALYREVAQLMTQKKITKLIGIGAAVTNAEHFTNVPNLETYFYKTTTDFLAHFQTAHFQNETILLKGARAFQFEKIAYRLSQKIHQTTLEVRLDAFVNNLNVFKNLLQPATKMMVMVKAAAYGHGSSEIAKLLEFNRVDYLAVAYTDEGVELRKSGITLPILVLNPEPASFEALIRNRLEPEIYNFNIFHLFLTSMVETGCSIPYPIHLKVDTGMHRLGFDFCDVEKLAAELSDASLLQVQSIFSHLAGSDAARFDDFTAAQYERFQEFYQKITAVLGYRPLRHILNSGGIARFPNYQMDMVRLGIGLYGIDSSAVVQQQLQTVSALRATISQIKNIAPNDTIGYNRSGQATHALRTATISIGYADGLMRTAGNGKISVRVRGKDAPTIGNVCMDMTMIDITAIPEAKEGDTVTIFDESKSVSELGQQLGTIAYEVFTSISGRVKRVYVLE